MAALADIGRALVRGGTVAATAAWYLGPKLIRRDRLAMATAASRASHSLGSTYLKFGQLVASSPGVVGEDVADVFRSCLDTGPPIGQRDLHAAIARAARRPVSDAYASVDAHPIGTASIAVVHAGRTRDGERVAIKVRRPGVTRRVQTDISLLRALVLAGMRFGKSADAAVAVDLVDDLERNLRDELHFDKERSAMERIGRRLHEHGFDQIVVPTTHPDLSDDGVLVMELLDGVAIDDAPGLHARGLDAGPLVDEVIRAWLVTSLVDGEFHADCHAGNVLVLEDGRLGLLDWGIVGHLDAAARTFLVRMLEGSLGDETAWIEVTDFFVRLYGDEMYQQFRSTPEELPGLLRDLIGPMLQAPFGESALGDFLSAVKERANAAADVGGSLMSENVRAQTRDPGTELASFEHGFFLWIKQLVYFERYARLHHRQRSIASYACEVLPLVAGGAREGGPDGRTT